MNRYVSFNFRSLAVAILVCTMYSSLGSAQQKTQSDLTRRVKTQVQPTYPELARRINVKGTVKLMVTVGANGSVKSTKVVGGHPLLVGASEDAVRRWKFEPATEESTGIVEFTFQPND